MPPRERFLAHLDKVLGDKYRRHRNLICRDFRISVHEYELPPGRIFVTFGFAERSPHPFELCLRAQANEPRSEKLCLVLVGIAGAFLEHGRGPIVSDRAPEVRLFRIERAWDPLLAEVPAGGTIFEAVPEAV